MPVGCILKCPNFDLAAKGTVSKCTDHIPPSSTASLLRESLFPRTTPVLRGRSAPIRTLGQMAAETAGYSIIVKPSSSENPMVPVENNHGFSLALVVAGKVTS